MLVAADYPFLEVVGTMLVFFAWIIWFWLIIKVAIDVFRRHDIGGGKKCIWIIFIIFVPFIGVFAYLIINGSHMAERDVDEVKRSQTQFDAYVRSARATPAVAGRRPRSRAPRSCSTAARSLRPSSTRSRRRRSRSARKVQRMDDIGPVQYLIVSFPGNKFKGEILPELANLVESGTIRIIDLAFVGKDASGNTLMFEVSDLDPAIQKEFGAMDAEPSGLFNEDDLRAAAEELEHESSAALLVWEDVWATKLAAAIRNAGGEVLDLDRIPREVVVAAREYALAQSTS